MKIKKNDTVTVLAGKDKGKSGKVVRAYPDSQKVIVEGANLVVKHVRARKSGERGQRVYLPSPLRLSKVQLVCPACGKATRAGTRVLEGARQKRERFCKKCSAAI
ncbi:50S ribosomal protein L24 [Candidatus Uhrbacteria bacterium]|nr:50S ribosomal protein L24 [Candidatus Uhrbacteria bacterium]